MSVNPEFDAVEIPSRYAKAFVAIVTAGLTAVLVALNTGPIEAVGVVNVALAVLTAVGVYLVPNLSKGVGQGLKAVVAVVGTALQALIPYLTEGTVTPAGWVVVTLAALGALSVGIAPNAQSATFVEDASGEVF